MGWNAKYWDALDQLYWDPDYLGLRSIAQLRWRRSDGWISVPDPEVNLSGPLYTRGRNSSAWRDHLHRQEEILNHLFNLTFAIAPDDLIARTLLHHLEILDPGPFQSLGREVRQRYGWGANNMQQDGLFVSEAVAVGIEMKLTATSSATQIAKYAALLMWEERYSGKKTHLGLLYIVPATAMKNHWRKCGLQGPVIDADFVDRTNGIELPSEIRALIDNNPEHWRSTLSRMKLAVISWHQLRDRLDRVRGELNPSTPGDQTLVRLISGFLDQLGVHQGTGLGAED
jgi:hypothetical protein